MLILIAESWSDGLGNDDITNSLPTCQLSRIQRLVNNLYAENNPSSDYDYVPTGRLGNELIPFWIDTLCVPVGDGKERKDAIKMMAEIYRRADKVLVLDSFILSLPCSADVVEKYLRIHLSKWHHRLWTMQEGQLASNLFFQFDGGAESFSDMSYNERLRLNVCDPAILSSPLQLLCTTELDAFYRYFEQARPDYGANITTRMRSCAKYLRSRQTSRYSDEPVCIANILGLASEEILKVKDPIERMATFYELVRDFDPRIIFHEHPRLPLEGFGWAPRSFLHQVPDLIAIRQGGLHLDGQSLATKLIPGGGGLPIQFPGFELVGRLQPLLAGSWGFIRAWVGGDYRFPTQWSYENATPWWSCTYKVEVLPEVEGVNTVYEDGASRYAVILPTSIHPSAMTDPGVTGILGKVDPSVPETPKGLPLWVWTTSHGSSDNHKPAFFVQYMLPVRYVCRVRVSMPSPTVVPQGSAFTWALCFREEQQWSLR